MHAHRTSLHVDWADVTRAAVTVPRRIYINCHCSFPSLFNFIRATHSLARSFGEFKSGPIALLKIHQ